MAEYKPDKYLILQTEDIAKLPNTKRIMLDEIIYMIKSIREAEGKEGLPEYIACKKDEPYADKVWEIISDGEDAKIHLCPWCNHAVEVIQVLNSWIISCAHCDAVIGNAEFTIPKSSDKAETIQDWNERCKKHALQG